MIEKTLVIIKPRMDYNVPFIMSCYAKAGLRIIRIDPVQFDRELIGRLYGHKKTAPFYEEVANYMISGVSWAVILEGENAIELARVITGDTDPEKADPGTVRRLFGEDKTHNAAHASDSLDNYLFETRLIFEDEPCVTDL